MPRPCGHLQLVIARRQEQADARRRLEQREVRELRTAEHHSDHARRERLAAPHDHPAEPRRLSPNPFAGRHAGTLRQAGAMDMPRRPLGPPALEVSRLSLGSWRTFERISRDDGLAVMRAAREAGINFLDDARYNDETGKAPIPTGYSEVLFGELFRAAGWQRDETIVCNKLWWEFWPDQSAAEELDGSLGRMGLDHIDVIYANVPPDALPLEQMVHDVAGLIAAGKARAWAIVNWPADQLLELSRTRASRGRAAAHLRAARLQPRPPLAGRGRRHAHRARGLWRTRRRVLRARGRRAQRQVRRRPSGGPGRWRTRPAHVRRRRDRRPFAQRCSLSDSRRLRPRLPWPSRCRTPPSRRCSSVRPRRRRSSRTSLRSSSRRASPPPTALTSLRSGRERQWTASGSWLGSQPVTMYRTRSPMFTP